MEELGKSAVAHIDSWMKHLGQVWLDDINGKMEEIERLERRHAAEAHSHDGSVDVDVEILVGVVRESFHRLAYYSIQVRLIHLCSTMMDMLMRLTRAPSWFADPPRDGAGAGPPHGQETNQATRINCVFINRECHTHTHTHAHTHTLEKGGHDDIFITSRHRCIKFVNKRMLSNSSFVLGK